MIIWKYLDNYICNSEGNNQLFTTIQQTLDYIQFKKSTDIICNCVSDILDSDLSYQDKIYDFNIYYWLKNNQGIIKLEIDNLNSIYNYIEELKKDFKLDLLKQTNQFTIMYYKINKLFHFEYNYNEVLKLKEKHYINKKFNEKLKIKETYDWIETLEKGISYNFINATGRIYPKGFSLNQFNKKYFYIFKKDDWNYYQIDLKCFYPRFLSLYIDNSIYLNDDFYQIYANKLNVSREVFKKEMFNKFLNGGRIENQQFYDLFPDILEFKDELTVPFINAFKRKIYCQNYQRLGYLISTTAEDYLKQLISYLYDKYKDNEEITFIWLKFDEFFIKTKNKLENYDLIEKIKGYYSNNLINVKVKTVD